MKIEKFVVGMVGTNCYLLINDETKECLIVDPGECPAELLSHIRQKQYRPGGILLTHGHFDHILGVDKMRRAFTFEGETADAEFAGCLPVYACEKERSLLEDALLNVSTYYGPACTVKGVTYLSDGQEIELAGFGLQVIHTPGHTCGGCCYYLSEEQVLFSGDTLFCASIGRSDFPTGNGAQLVQSIRERLLILPDETRVYPGHMDETTIAYEKEHNPFI